MSVDLSTTYLGLNLTNPLVASSSPLTGSTESLARLEDVGIAAAILPSLFEEQLVKEQLEINAMFESQTESFAESLDFFPELDLYNTGSERYLKLLERAKAAVSIPLIGSLNGFWRGGWTKYAKLMQEAGADALELNIYYIPVDVEESSAQIEDRYVELVAEVRESISIPLSVKLGPYFTALPQLANRLEQAGADGIVLFNRYLEPDLDLEGLEYVPGLVFSRPYDARLTLRWMAILRDQIGVSLGATSGVHSWEEVAKLLLSGADCVMLAAQLLQFGEERVTDILQDLTHWFDERGYQSVEQLKGSMSRSNCPDPGSLERLNYMKTLTNYTDQWNRSWG